MHTIQQTTFHTNPANLFTHITTPTPTPPDDEVLIRIHATALDQSVWHLMAGRPYLMRLAGYGLRKPTLTNPTRTFAGTIAATGKNVTEYQIGDRVYGCTNNTAAQYATANPQKIAPTPSNLTDADAAAIPMCAQTAHEAITKHGGVTTGDHVLITGAAGAVGAYAVQIAAALGADVTAVDRAEKQAAVLGIGAKNFLDYRSQDPFARENSYDVIIDIAGNPPVKQLRHSLKPAGRVVFVGGEGGGAVTGGIQRAAWAALTSRFSSQDFVMFVAGEDAAGLMAVSDLVTAGTLQPVIDSVFDMSDFDAAMARLCHGSKTGRVVVTLP